MKNREKYVEGRRKKQDSIRGAEAITVKSETVIAENEIFHAPRQLGDVVSSTQKVAHARAASAAPVAIRLLAPPKVTVVFSLASAA